MSKVAVHYGQKNRGYAKFERPQILGGKPNADDSNRPERAKPARKRVIIFSPHPDDDDISMGGTFKRLQEQEHEVHVAYQTSGNIAVADSEALRYASFVCDYNDRFEIKSGKADNI